MIHNKWKYVLVGIAVLVLAGIILPLRAFLTARAEQPGQASPALDLPTDGIIIKYRADVAPANQEGPLQGEEMERLSQAAETPLTYFRPMSGNAHVIKLAQALPDSEVAVLAARLVALPEVEYAEPDSRMIPFLTPNDPEWGNQWDMWAPGGDHYGLNAEAAWNISTGSPSIVVAVIDTGITNHPDLAGRTVPGYDFISDPWGANDGDGRDADPSDPGDWTSGECGSPSGSSWHGTHVAGTIGAASNNGMGVAGVNWQSMLQTIRVLGKCGGSMSDIVDGMRWAAGLSVAGVPANATPARVLNMSLGGSGACTLPSRQAYQLAINEIVAAGAVVVVAAGNSNDNASQYSPASCNNVITVAASDRYGGRAYYSN